MDEKKTSYVSTRPIFNESGLNETSEAREAREDALMRLEEQGGLSNDVNWRPGYLSQFPWLGFCALTLVILCGVGCLVTLLVADNTAEVYWGRVGPNVIVTILNSFANICFATAIANGVAIAWWRKTLHGATIQQLNRSWQFSSSIKDVVFGAKYFNFIALAAVTSKLIIIDAALFQRAIVTEIRPLDLGPNWNVTGYANTSFPLTGRTSGPRGGETQGQGLLASNFNDNLKIWNQGGGLLPNAYSNCNGTCYLTVPGAGFEFDCEEPKIVPFDAGLQVTGAFDALRLLTQGLNVASSDLDDFNCTSLADNFNRTLCQNIQPKRDAWLFHVGFAPVWSNESTVHPWTYINMTVRYSVASTANETSCPGSIYSQSCTLRPAVIEYPVKIQNATNGITGMSLNVDGNFYENATFRNYNLTLKQQNGFKVLNYSEIYENPKGGDRTHLGGVAEGLEMYLGGNASIHYGDEGYHLVQRGNAPTYLRNDMGVQEGVDNSAAQCGFQYSDPMSTTDTGGWAAKDTSHRFDVPSLVGKINQIMFATSVDISDGDKDKDVAAGTLTRQARLYRDEIFYRTNRPFMWGALASMLFCVFCVLPVYWGYWQLGRSVSLGPFEIAAAFRAPNLQHDSHAPDVKSLIREVGDRRVQFGAIVTGDDVGRVGVAEPERVSRIYPSAKSATSRPSRWTMGSGPDA
ncbi:hypothetical protein Slin15195_G002780 [Septoria linicola]|uniref:Uncharacterized protein n=1 Tax=Septoria linicola TaxID=215465 RepID=A0A9Q9AG65_9PEZI|nr:hypothetical protein Slin15195_G002780 [Septoria linicola]